MRVVYDHQVFWMQRYGGISRYFYELATRLNGIPGIKASVVAPFHKNEYLLNLQFPHLLGNHYPGQHLGGRTVVRQARNFTLPLIYRTLKRVDLLHETYYSSVPSGQARARIVTVYDMIHEVFSDSSSLKLDDNTSISKSIAISRADHIICISEATRRDLIDILRVDESKTSVVHLGYSLLAPVVPNAAVVPHEKPFLLYVGNRAGYKNFSRLCHAYARSRSLRQEFDLVAFGGGKFSEDENKLFRQLDIPASVKQIEGDDRLLAAYYKSASLFVYPSLYEGFGIPPLEAMNYDCPVACSQTSSIPEVVGDAGCYFDPESIDSMVHVLEKLALSSELQEEMKTKGRNRLGLFSWEKCVLEHAQIYRSLI